MASARVLPSRQILISENKSDTLTAGNAANFLILSLATHVIQGAAQKATRDIGATLCSNFGEPPTTYIGSISKSCVTKSGSLL